MHFLSNGFLMYDENAITPLFYEKGMKYGGPR